MAGADSFSNTNFEYLLNDSYKWYLQDYMKIPAIYPRMCNMSQPPGFDASLPYYRGAVGVLDPEVRDIEEHENVETSGAFEDYTYMMRRRRKYTAAQIPEGVVEAGERGLVNFMQEFTKSAAEKMVITKDKFVTNMWNYGPLTTATDTSKKYLDNTITSRAGGYEDTNHGMLYDGVPVFDTAHPQSRVITGTTYSNHDSTLTFTRGNLQTIYTRMAVTNAKDRNGDEITIRPNQIIYHPSLKFTVEPILGAPVVDADLQPNIVGQMGWEKVENPYLADSTDSTTTGFFVAEARKDLLFIDNWKSTKIDIWFENRNQTWFVALFEYFGATFIDWRHSYCAGYEAS